MIAICGIFPDIAEPELVIEVDTRTVMYLGTLDGGPELLPGSLVHLPPHVAGFGFSEFA